MISEILIDTDVMVDFISTGNNDNLLNLLSNYSCFTSVINASELFKAVNDEQEKKIIINFLKAFKVLGINSRLSIELSLFNKDISLRDAIIIAISEKYSLAIVTLDKNKYLSYCKNIFSVNELLK